MGNNNIECLNEQTAELRRLEKLIRLSAMLQGVTVILLVSVVILLLIKS